MYAVAANKFNKINLVRQLLMLQLLRNVQVPRIIFYFLETHCIQAAYGNIQYIRGFLIFNLNGWKQSMRLHRLLYLGLRVSTRMGAF